MVSGSGASSRSDSQERSRDRKERRSRSRSRDRSRGRERSRNRSRSRSRERSKKEPEKTPVVRCFGLPWEAKEEDVFKFFDGLSVRKVQFTLTRDGKATGECYVEFKSEEDGAAAQGKNREHMGRRYIEVFASSVREMENAKDVPGELPRPRDRGRDRGGRRGPPFRDPFDFYDYGRFPPRDFMPGYGMGPMGGPGGRGASQCYQCGGTGHFARECPSPATARPMPPMMDFGRMGGGGGGFGGGPRGGPPGGDGCYRCGMPGHFARECPTLGGGGGRGGGGGGGPGGACFRCNEPGHFARDCPNAGGDRDRGRR